MLDFLVMAQQCAPTVAPQTMHAVVKVESDFNPYAIGVVGGRLARQPANLDEAVATAKALEAAGWNFSVGLAQVNRYNLGPYNISYTQAFDACTSLRVGSKILEDCYGRAAKARPDPQGALHAAISCYYSNNFTRGFVPDAPGQPSYVQKVLASADLPADAIPVVPAPKGGARLKAVRATEEGEPSAPADNAPVLLRRDSGDTAKPSEPPEPVVTGGERPRNPLVTNVKREPSGDAAPQPEPQGESHKASSTVVF